MDTEGAAESCEGAEGLVWGAEEGRAGEGGAGHTPPRTHTLLTGGGAPLAVVLEAHTHTHTHFTTESVIHYICQEERRVGEKRREEKDKEGVEEEERREEKRGYLLHR